MTIEMLKNARNWATKHQKVASDWGSAPDPAETPEMAPLLKFLGTPLIANFYNARMFLSVMRAISSFYLRLRTNSAAGKIKKTIMCIIFFIN